MALDASIDAADTFPKLLKRNVAVRGDRPAYRVKEYGIWQSWTWAEIAAEIEAQAKGLIALGLVEGDHVAIIGRNRPELYGAMVAVQMAGGIPVPLYHDSVGEEMAYVLDHAGARFVVAEDQEQVDKVLEVSDALPGLERILYLDPRGLRRYDHARLSRLEAVAEQGRTEGDAGELARRIAGQDADTTCVMLYTSGTTGRPKGVVLSNRNIIETSRASALFDTLVETDSVLAYLPMAWVGDFIFSMGQAYWSGFCVACPESEETMQHDLREIGPTYFFAPPRFFEGLLTNVMIRMEDAGLLKRRLFHHFMAFAKTWGPRILDGEAVPLPQKLWYQLGALAIYGPLKNTLGLTRVRVGSTAA